MFLWSFQWVAVIVYLPLAITAILHQHTPVKGWVLLVITATLHGIYVILLSQTYTGGDLSQVYPLMRGVSPLLVPLIGVFFLSERLSGLGWLDVACIVIGIWILGEWRFGNHKNGLRLAPKAKHGLH